MTVGAAPGRRHILARQIVTLLRSTLPPTSQLELVLASGAPPDRTTAARVLIAGPDALARMLWPPSADALGEAYLRGDIDIEGDIWAAVDAGRSFHLRRLGRDLPRLARLGLEPRLHPRECAFSMDPEAGRRSAHRTDPPTPTGGRQHG